MGKRLFLIIASMVAAVLMPGTLMATDDVVAGEPEFNAVETVLPPEPEPVVETGLVYDVAATEPVYVAPAPRVMNFTVTYRVGNKEEYDVLANNLSDNDVYKFQKMVYAHSYVIGDMENLRPGDRFVVTEGAMAQTYEVASSTTYSLSDLTPSLMWEIAYNALGHDLSMMTCHGINDSERWVVIADAV